MTAPSQHDDLRAVASVAIVGNDAMLSAAPATPVQLAHACLRRGFTVAIPTSWGDEIIAAETLRQLAARAKGPSVMCVCPYVRARLLAPGPDLAPFLVSLVAPPVAVARYVRALYADRAVHLTYIGGCPSGDDPAIDVHLTADTFFADLAEHGIVLGDQPLVFDSIVPPDRRRWHSLPGGIPSAEVLWAETDGRALVELEPDDISTDLAQHIITHEHALIDLAPGLGCACSGAMKSIPPRSARVAVAALEPPRALGPVVDPAVPVRIDMPLTGLRSPARESALTSRTGAVGPHESSARAPHVASRAEREAALESVAESAADRADESDAATLVDPNVKEADSSEVAIVRPPPIKDEPGELGSGEAIPAKPAPAAAPSTAAPSMVEPDGERFGSRLAGRSARRRTPASGAVRPASTSIPRTTTPVGHILPRAYAAKRKSWSAENVHAPRRTPSSAADAPGVQAPAADVVPPVGTTQSNGGPPERAVGERAVASVLRPGESGQLSSAAARSAHVPSPPAFDAAPSPSATVSTSTLSARRSERTSASRGPETPVGDAWGWLPLLVVAALVALGAIVVATLR